MKCIGYSLKMKLKRPDLLDCYDGSSLILRHTGKCETSKKFFLILIAVSFSRDPCASNNMYFKVKPVTRNTVNYVKFGNGGVVTGVNPHGDAFKFWDEMFEKYKSLFYK